MPTFLLDTNIVSFTLRGSSALLDQRMARVSALDLAISSITEAELLYGAGKKPPQARVHRLLAGFLPSATVLPWTSTCAKEYAALSILLESVGEPLSIFDTMIAAHARAIGLILITHDSAFRRVPGITIEDWTQPA